MARSSVDDPFPVAGASRRRRMLLHQATALAAGTGAPSAAAELRAVDRLPAGETPTFATIQTLLGRPEPLTWVFTGDDLTDGDPQSNAGRGLAESFADRVRRQRRRWQDVVIATDRPGGHVRDLLAELDRRALRFRPDVVSVMIGSGEILGPPRSPEDLRRDLTELVNRLRTAGAILILHTPHRIPAALDRAQADLRNVVRNVRELARSLRIPCVDHWAAWKEAHADDAALRAWLDTGGLHPNRRGRRELSRLLFRKLGLDRHPHPTGTASVPRRPR